MPVHRIPPDDLEKSVKELEKRGELIVAVHPWSNRFVVFTTGGTPPRERKKATSAKAATRETRTAE